MPWSDPPEISLLDPIARIPLHVEPPGYAVSAWVDFDDGQDLLYIFESVDYTGVYGWLRWHAPTLALLAAIAALGLLLWRGRRVLLRPQQRGKSYCRRCNYDLTPASASAAPLVQCPECGADLGQHRPRRGTGRLGRLAPWVAIFVASLALCGGVMHFTLTRWPSGFPWDSPWPAPIAQRIGPLGGVARIHGSEDERVRISVHALPSGKRQRHFASEGLSSNWGARLAPGGRWIVGVTQYPEPGKWLRLIDAASGAVSVVPIEGPVLYPGLVAFSGDGERAYIQWQSPRESPESHSLFRLEELELATGATRLVAEVPLLWVPDRRAEALEPPRAVFAVDPAADGDTRWCLAIYRGISAAGDIQMEFMLPAERSFQLDLPKVATHVPRLSAGQLELIDFGARQTVRIDLAAQTFSTSPMPDDYWSAIPPNRPGPFAAVHAAAGGEVELRSRHAGNGDIVARLAVPPGRPMVPHVSPQGRWAALIVFDQQPTLWSQIELAPQRTTYELQIWDLRGLAAPR